MRPPRALLIDIDGVLVVSWQALPGAVEALAAVREVAGVRFLTNTTSRTRAEITSALRDAGFAVGDEEVVTVTAAVAEHLRRAHPGARCLLLSSGDVTADLPGVDVVREPPADVVVLGGAGEEFGYDALNRALAALLDGAALVAMHRNLLWRTATGLQLDTGAYLAGLEAASGVRATVIGKPEPAMFDAALGSLDVAAHEAAMVGDDLDTDVRAAQALGITGIQVRTGKFRSAQLEDGGPAPDVLLDSFADLPRWLTSGR
ncbi:TIGR01458 family HAD-type hydrolase [Actinotalea sp. M2MS4P-6]|uniref:TIGR01458 family HAD-type hydrolase n=1 Tax=Actinotalea sp. M2MS4P-6 TaxID=2983762 RepID=UPI0021E43B72|nr:TIGR01458 family HAD-type hydrolase [Actinotalea sp. M2MS4P-6]MCV2393288.1 TIGR01458 family HAD-type hydrolase [Actinotalea sp. M2MS4P-6]